MTLPIIWRLHASSDLAEIIGYVTRENPLAAKRLRKLLMSAVEPVSEHPYLYPQSELFPGLRKIVAHPNYIICYKVTATSIEVVNVVHARQQYPKL